MRGLENRTWVKTIIADDDFNFTSSIDTVRRIVVVEESRNGWFRSIFLGENNRRP